MQAMAINICSRYFNDILIPNLKLKLKKQMETGYPFLSTTNTMIHLLKDYLQSSSKTLNCLPEQKKLIYTP